MFCSVNQRVKNLQSSVSIQIYKFIFLHKLSKGGQRDL